MDKLFVSIDDGQMVHTCMMLGTPISCHIVIRGWYCDLSFVYKCLVHSTNSFGDQRILEAQMGRTTYALPHGNISGYKNNLSCSTYVLHVYSSCTWARRWELGEGLSYDQIILQSTLLNGTTFIRSELYIKNLYVDFICYSCHTCIFFEW